MINECKPMRAWLVCELLSLAWGCPWKTSPPWIHRTLRRYRHLLHLEIYRSMCPFCNESIETADHLFMHCSVVWKLWNRFMKWLSIQWCIPNSTIDELLRTWSPLVKKKFQSNGILMLAFGIAWEIWMVSNKLVF